MSQVQVCLDADCWLTGTETSLNERPVFAFKGIPYAQPPTGDLRLKAPVPLQLWRGKKDATDYGPIGPQDTSVMKNLPHKCVIPDKQSEDCLLMNIWTPTLNTDDKKAVILWIHGGGFIGGWSNLYEGDALTAYEDVVFVSINYRCGIFGFLSTGDDVISGNYGILDQTEALRWVQKYITKFGGDPDNVTLAGQSAGAISGCLHLTSKEPEKLFHKVICQSGTTFIPGMTWSKEKSREVAHAVMEKLGCESVNSEDILRFLQNLSTEDIMSKLSPGDIFRPCVDENLISDTSITSFESLNVPMIIGCNNSEGALMTQLFCGFKIPDDLAFDMVLRIVAMMAFRDSLDEVVKDIKSEYFESATEEHRLRGIVELLGDFVFVYPSIITAENHKGNTYFYYFDIKPSYSPYPEWVGADHSADLSFVQGHMLFNYTQLPSWTFNEEEAKLSKDIMKYWATFARTGNPNTDGLVEWPKYTQATKQYINLKQNISVQNHLKERRVEFWRNLVHKYNAFIIQ